MKKSEKTRQTTRWVFFGRRIAHSLLLIPVFILVIFLVGCGFFFYEWINTASVGNGDTPKHTLTSDEKFEIKLADESNGNLYQCVNNIEDDCLDKPAISFYPLGYSNGSLGAFQPDSGQTVKQICGRVRAIKNDVITITTTSGRKFTIHFPSGSVAAFDTYASQNFNVASALNRSLLLTYTETLGNSSLDIAPYQIVGSTVGNTITDNP